MNHLLITELAHIDVVERVRTAERERLARGAGALTREPRRLARVGLAVRLAMSGWRSREEARTLSLPMCADERVDVPAR